MAPSLFSPAQTPKGHSGRADLLHALILADLDPDREAALAALLGFKAKPEELVEKPSDENDRKVEIKEQADDKPQQKTEGIFHPYRLVAIEEPTVTNEERQSAREDSFAQGKLTDADNDVWDVNKPTAKVSPIVPWARLWPRLRQAVACRHSAGIDIDHLTEQFARGKVMRRLPLRTRLAWPNPLPVVLDFSDRLTAYWDDWHWLRQHLESSLHRQVCFYRLNGIPDRPLQVLLRGRPSAQYRPWPRLNQGETLLLVSDLGMVDPAHPWPSQCWQNKLASYQRRGVKVVVLAPVSLRHLQADLVNLAATVRLSPDSTLRPCSRLVPQSFEPVAAQKISAPSARLLAMMSVATRIEPGLLRSLRRCLPDDGQDAGLEGEVWCHPELDTAATACAIAPWAVAAWRDKFKDLPDILQQQTLNCLREWHAGLPKAIHHEETLLHWHLAGKRIASDEPGEVKQAYGFFNRLTNTLRENNSPGKSNAVRALQVQFAGRHVEWVAPTLTDDYLVRLSAAVAIAEPERYASPPLAIDPVAWLNALPSQEPKTRYLLQLPDMALRVDSTLPYQSLGISPLAAITLDRQVLLWGWGDDGQAPAYQAWYWDAAPTDTLPRLPPLLMAANKRQSLYLHNGLQCLQFKCCERPEWASAFGQDNYGLFAELELNGIIQRFRWINPGTFLMGSPDSEPGRWEKETQHEVTLTEGYWLADTACTQALWQAVTGRNPSRFQDDPNNPVENVSWDDVQMFIEQLNDMTPELRAKLPSEAQWEYACRAGTTTPFSFGDNITPEQVNYDGKHPYAGGAKGADRKKTVPVKSLPVNPWGLYETHGNVWEWCADWYRDYNPEAAVDPEGVDSGSFRVLRGGSWFGDGRNARSAFRNGSEPADRNANFGFRLALG